MLKSKLVRLFAKNAQELKEGQYRTNLDSADLSNVLGVALKTCIFQNNVYNIFIDGEQKNNRFIYVLGDPLAGGIEYIYDIPQAGYYSLQQVIDLVLADINANMAIQYPAEPPVQMIIGPYSKKVEYTRVGAEPSTIVFGGDSAGAGLNIAMGNSSDVETSDATYVFEDFANLTGLESVTISVSSKSPKSILNLPNNKPLYTNSLGVIPVTVEFGGIQSYIQPDLDAAKLIFSYPEDMTEMRFTLRDANGNRITGQRDHLLVELIVWYEL